MIDGAFNCILLPLTPEMKEHLLAVRQFLNASSDLEAIRRLLRIGDKLAETGGIFECPQCRTRMGSECLVCKARIELLFEESRECKR